MDLETKIENMISEHEGKKKDKIQELEKLKNQKQQKLNMQDKLKISLSDLNRRIEILEEEIENFDSILYKTAIKENNSDPKEVLKFIYESSKDKEKKNEEEHTSSSEPTSENSSEGVHEETEEERAKRERKESLGLPV
ncbi:MAG: hypothetical protein IKN43_01000 [Selenomonadaceae bacterium]|nr:hypothetical protein [Selenomonadaceae bacterium]